MRLDQYIASNFGFSRNRAQFFIDEKLVKVNDKIITKTAFQVEESDKVEIIEDKRVEFVARSAIKLDEFLKEVELDISWKTCLDVGASTWWFTQVLLSRWACQVVAVDVWTSQLHKKIKNDKRVISLENTDIRELKIENWKLKIEKKLDSSFHSEWQEKEIFSSVIPAKAGIQETKIPNSTIITDQKSFLDSHFYPKSTSYGAHGNDNRGNNQNDLVISSQFSLIVVDVSFISLNKILDSLINLSSNETRLILLFKPQFEVGKINLKKSWVPKNEKVIVEALDKFKKLCKEKGLKITKISDSKLPGEAWNKEYLIFISQLP